MEPFKLSLPMFRYLFSYVPGYFVDSVEAAKACLDSKLTTQPNLGLLESWEASGTAPNPAGEAPWARFSRHLEWLNTSSPPGVSYKLLYLLRHGLSVHNVVMAKVGREAWNVRAVIPGPAVGQLPGHARVSDSLFYRATGPISKQTVK
jgi:hypothetical protein